MSSRVLISLLFEIMPQLQKMRFGGIECFIILSSLNGCSSLPTGLHAPFPVLLHSVSHADSGLPLPKRRFHPSAPLQCGATASGRSTLSGALRSGPSVCASPRLGGLCPALLCYGHLVAPAGFAYIVYSARQPLPTSSARCSGTWGPAGHLQCRSVESLLNTLPSE